MVPWILQMAWRDSRGSRRRLLLYVGSMVLGVAALVAINSFGDNLRRAVDDQARTLLGADLSMERGQPFPDSIEVVIDALGGDQSRRVSFASMALFPQGGHTRLATVRAQEGGFPFYGAIETDPPEASAEWLVQGQALVDRTLMQQFELQTGDSVRVGRRAYRIAGALLKTPRESAAVSLFAPRVYVPLAGIDTTLFGLGSRAEYEVYFRFRDGRDVEALADSLRSELRPARVGIDSVAEERDDWDEALTNMYRFLSLVGFIALLLGSLGVASAVHVYVKQRIDTVAVLRVFGAKARSTVAVYLIQAVGMGATGAAMGAALGVAIQMGMPVLLADLLPIEVDFRVAWGAVLFGAGIGIGVTVLFAMLPLLAVRRISPLRALRSQVDESAASRWDLPSLAIKALVALGVVAFAVMQAPTPAFGVGYAAAIAVVFGALAGMGRLLIWVIRRSSAARFPYVVRQGLANLQRPNNQTLLLTLSMGLGTFLIAIMLVTQATLLAQVSLSGGEDRANLVFFDIQTDQSDGVVDSLAAAGVRVLERVPIVTMRLASVKGRTIQEIRADSTRGRRLWPYTREYRSSYRNALTASETLVDGEFTGQAPATGLIPVSAEREIAADLGIEVGDTLVWNVQGLPVETVLGSIRAVDWRQVGTNFFFLFPDGVLEAAPRFDVVLGRAPNDEVSAAAQASVVRAYPNVSAIDVSLVLTVFDAIFSRIAFVIRFMALFSVLTGFVVLSGAVVISRLQRIAESVLLKTLGASQRQVTRIMLVEYVALGTLSSATGLLLALAAGWTLARFVFETPFVAGGPALLVIGAGVVVVVVLIGILGSRGVYRRPALEVLRQEV